MYGKLEYTLNFELWSYSTTRTLFLQLELLLQPLGDKLLGELLRVRVTVRVRVR